MPPLETRTESAGETPEVPQDPCQHWRGILRFLHRLHTRSYDQASTGETSREAAEQLARGLAILRPPMRVPEVPVVSREHLAQLEKIQEVLPSRRDEGHFCSGVSRLITPNLWRFQRVLTPLLQLKNFPDNPSPLESKHESPAHIQRSPVSASYPGGIISLRGRKRIPGILVASQ